MLLGNTHIVKAVPVPGSKLRKPRSRLHGGRNGADPLIPLRQPGQFPAEHGGKAVGRGNIWVPRFHVKASYAMIGGRILLCVFVPLPLPGLHIHQCRLMQ